MILKPSGIFIPGGFLGGKITTVYNFIIMGTEFLFDIYQEGIG